MTLLPNAFIAKLRQILGPRGVIDDATTIAPHVREWRDKYQGKAEIMAAPASAEEISEVVKLARAYDIAIVPQGGNTGLVGGSLPGLSGQPDLLVSSKRLTHIGAADSRRGRLIAGAGATIHDVQQAAAAAGMLFPLSLASEGSCTVGGTIATNAGGVHVIRYGTMRALVAGVQAVLPSGEIIDTLSGLAKDNRGPQIASILAGSEGTMGMITAASLKLFAAENHHITLWLGLDNLDAALDILAEMSAVSNGCLSAFEIMSEATLNLAERHITGVKLPVSEPYPWHALIEFGSNQPDPALYERIEGFLLRRKAQGSIAQNANQRAAFWRIRESLSEAQKHEGLSIKHDISLPQDKIPAFVTHIRPQLEAKWPGSRMMIFGHLGDGNLHFNLMQPTGDTGRKALADGWETAQTLVHEAVTTYGGSLSAEHGIGRMKRDDLARLASVGEIQLLRQLKAALDPDNLWNPGVLI